MPIKSLISPELLHWGYMRTGRLDRSVLPVLAQALELRWASLGLPVTWGKLLGEAGALGCMHRSVRERWGQPRPGEAILSGSLLQRLLENKGRGTASRQRQLLTEAGGQEVAWSRRAGMEKVAQA